MAKRIQIGDIVEIPTKKGLAYAQFTLTHSKYGALLRVLPGFFENRPADFSCLVNEKELFVTFFPVQAAINQNIFQIVSNIEVPVPAKKLPLFKTGIPDPITKKIETWWLWDGEKEWKVGKLESHQVSLPIRGIVNNALLIERIETGWTSADEVSSELLNQFLIEDCDQKVQEKLLTEIAKQRGVASDVVQKYSFNRFIVSIDFKMQSVIIQDNLDVSEAGSCLLPLDTFVRHLKK